MFQKDEYNVLILGLDNAGKTVSKKQGHERKSPVHKKEQGTGVYLLSYTNKGIFIIDVVEICSS